MSKSTLCKTIRQHNKEPVPKENMEKLQEIADDYNKIRNYVYKRYGGIGSLKKLYPGYTIQNEMTISGIREQMEMPSVYFHLAVLDAIKDIKNQWIRTKSRILKLIGQNEGLSKEEKHYLRFLLKVSNAFIAVLNQEPVDNLPDEIQKQYDKIVQQVDWERMNRYLCRQVRKYHIKLHTSVVEGFPLTERAYRYGEHGIYISIKEKRKRIFIPLTDGNQYKTRIYMKLCPEQERVEIIAPVNVAVHIHEDYINQVGVSLGMNVMLTTDSGHKYGEDLGKYQMEYTEWMRKQTWSYQQNRSDNPGRKKYRAGKRSYEERLHSYINQELNRFLRIEKPGIVYMPRLPKPQAGGKNRKINYYATLWQRGYIRKRLIWKCREHSVEVAEVIGKDISSECSRCGMICQKQKEIFSCQFCGYSTEEKTNAAQNAKKRGEGGGKLNQDHKNNP